MSELEVSGFILGIAFTRYLLDSRAWFLLVFCILDLGWLDDDF